MANFIEREIDMPEIAHRIEIEASPEEVYEAITSPNRLSKWWTSASENVENANLLDFDFGGGHIVRMQVEEAVVPERVVWQCVEGPWADNGNFVFELEAIERGTNLRFTHHGWSDTDDFFRHCNGKWGFFLAVSLKGLLEVGQGQPSPNDPAI